jgi:polysaccharide export outer membrane protein
MNFLPSRSFLLVVLSVLMLTSCVNNKKLTERSVYFKDISDSLLLKKATEYEPVLQKGDILYIGVITPNEKSSKIFNSPNFYAGTDNLTNSAAGNSGGNTTQGYLIDEQGQITFPFLGKLPAAGLTKAALTDHITNGIKQYVDSAIVSIRLLNYRVTVLGEVMRPGTYSIPSERVTILDALGLAGDLTIYGRRDKIRIIRNTEGSRTTTTLNLNSGDIFSSPYFFLRQNDIVYVELNDRKIPNTDQASIRNISLALGIISAISVVISTINVLK